MQLLESPVWNPKMRSLPPFLIALSLAGPALSLEPQRADGDWMCDVRDAIFRIAIDGETYSYADAPLRGGNLALELDGVTYYIESGPLRDELGLTQIAFDGRDGGLILSAGDLGALTWVGACFRPQP